MRAKFRDDARLAEIHARLKALGAEVGIAFDFEAIRRSPNTLDAHRLIRWAAEAGFRTRSSKAIPAYFEQGRDIGDPRRSSSSRRNAVSTGKRCAAPRRTRMTSSDARRNRAAHRAGVHGVPFFIFAQARGIGGRKPRSARGGDDRGATRAEGDGVKTDGALRPRRPTTAEAFSRASKAARSSR